MTPEEKLAQLVRSLQDGGVDALIMGGHAVRYYGVTRNTIDYDLVVSLTTPQELRSRLMQIPSLGIVREEPVWRADDFARYLIGRLPDGREEWLEFWIRNHLLAAFPLLKSRAETGLYGGRELMFVALADLLKSKETERESDWLDIAALEEIQDGRNRAALGERDSLIRLLANLRSRRGMDEAIVRREANDRSIVKKPLQDARTSSRHHFSCRLRLTRRRVRCLHQWMPQWRQL